MGLVITMVGSHSPVGGNIMVSKVALAECPALVECMAMVDLNLGIGTDLDLKLDTGVNLFLNLDTGVNLLLNPGHSPMWSTIHQSKMAQVMQEKLSLLDMALASPKIGTVDLGALHKEILELLV